MPCSNLGTLSFALAIYVWKAFCRQRRSMDAFSTYSFHQINKIQKRFSKKGFHVELDGLSWWSNRILVAISLSRCFPERDHSMGIVYRSSPSRRSNRKRNSQQVFAWTLEVFDILIFPSLALKRFLYSNPRFSNFSLFRGIPLYLQNSTTMFPKRRIPAAVFATENTRLYPIKRRRWKQNGNSGYLDPSKCFQKLKNVAIHLKELVVYHCFEERI